MVFRMLLVHLLPASALVLELSLRVTSHWQGGSKCLGAFEKLRKATVSFVMSVCPSVRMYNLDSPTGWIIMKFYIRVFFENMLRRKLKFI